MKVWRYIGKERPDFAVAPKPGQESVWDYPRPPRLVPDDRHISIRVQRVAVADTHRAVRILETGGPPTFYLPAEDVELEYCLDSVHRTYCEWKGDASYFSIQVDNVLVENAGWRYQSPKSGFEAITGYYSFYPAWVECLVDDVRVKAQAGGFYGGWITDDVVGPFKGEPGTEGW